MGSRAGIFVLDVDGAVEVYFSGGAAQSLARDAALAGFDATLRRIRRMQFLGNDLAECVGAPWLEGGMLIDIPRRRLVWAEEGEAMVLPRIMNHLLEQTWPGWTAVWSPEEIRGIFHLAGTDPEPLFEDLILTDPTSIAEHPWFSPCSDQLGWTPLSVKLESGALVVWRTDVGICEISTLSPQEIIEFAREAHDTSVQGTGWGPGWWLRDSENKVNWPEDGIHIDVAARTLSWWSLWERDPCAVRRPAWSHP